MAKKTKKRRLSSKQQPKVQSFAQDVDPYRKQVFICTGAKIGRDIFDANMKLHPKKWFVDFMREQEKSWDEMLKNSMGFCSVDTDTGAGVISLPPYRDSWDFWETVLHELHHYVFILANKVGFQEDMEPQAYLVEFLFHQIRRKLQGVDKQ